MIRSIGAAIQLGNPINRDSPFARGLKAQWIALSGLTGGLRFLDVVNRNHATLTNGPTWRGGPFPGINCVKFDGTNDYATTPNSASLNIQTSGMAIACIVKGSSPAAFSYIVGKTNGSTTGYASYVGAASGLKMYVGNGSALQISSDAGTGMWDGRWHAIVQTTKSGHMYQYLDGIQKTDDNLGNVTPADSSATALTIGQAASQYINAYIASVAIYDRSVQGTDAWQLSREMMRGFPTLLNRVSPLRTFFMGTGATSGNRRRRVIIGAGQ